MYTIKKVQGNKWAVINGSTGLAQSFWANRLDARDVAARLNSVAWRLA